MTQRNKRSSYERQKLQRTTLLHRKAFNKSLFLINCKITFPIWRQGNMLKRKSIQFHVACYRVELLLFPLHCHQCAVFIFFCDAIRCQRQVKLANEGEQRWKTFYHRFFSLSIITFHFAALFQFIKAMNNWIPSSKREKVRIGRSDDHLNKYYHFPGVSSSYRSLKHLCPFISLLVRHIRSERDFVKGFLFTSWSFLRFRTQHVWLNLHFLALSLKWNLENEQVTVGIWKRFYGI